MISIFKKRKRVIPWWGYWLFFILTGFFLLLLEDGHDQGDLYAISVLLYFFLLFLVIVRWIFNQIRLIIRLRNEKTKTELVHLQSQVNPHFFFNILNNLYGWVEKDPKQAQKMILKLSEMMRYSIYDGQKTFVTLEEEIAYMKNYIELHKTRYLKKINISLNVDIQEAFKIKPLLFIILLENAFKHGVENLREDAYINIDVATQKNKLNFVIENNFDPDGGREESGIGLKNLKRRLELVYPNKHTLSLLKNGNIYKAQLTIKQA